MHILRYRNVFIILLSISILGPSVSEAEEEDALEPDGTEDLDVSMELNDTTDGLNVTLDMTNSTELNETYFNMTESIEITDLNNEEDDEIEEEMEEDIEEDIVEDEKMEKEESPILDDLISSELNETESGENSTEIAFDYQGVDPENSCNMTQTMAQFAGILKNLMEEMKMLREEIGEKCPSLDGNITASKNDTVEETDDDDSSSEEEEDEDKEEEDKETSPMIPTECDAPFKPIAKSCYFFVYLPNDWKNWGDANAYCQTLGGTLASPHHFEDLSDYLEDNFSSVFWVGAKRTPARGKFEWLTGNAVTEEEWGDDQPSKGAAKFCVYVESMASYKAVNHYCGEKFSFICEKRAPDQ